MPFLFKFGVCLHLHSFLQFGSFILQAPAALHERLLSEQYSRIEKKLLNGIQLHDKIKWYMNYIELLYLHSTFSRFINILDGPVSWVNIMAAICRCSSPLLSLSAWPRDFCCASEPSRPPQKVSRSSRCLTTWETSHVTYTNTVLICINTSEISHLHQNSLR